MSTKQSNKIIDVSSKDTTSNIVVSMEDSGLAAAEDLDPVATNNTNPRWKWYLIFFGLQLILFSSALELQVFILIHFKTLGGCTLYSTFYLYNSSIVSTALPKIGSDLDAMSTTSWVVTV